MSILSDLATSILKSVKKSKPLVIVGNGITDVTERAVLGTFRDHVLNGDARAVAQKALLALAVARGLSIGGNNVDAYAKLARLEEGLREAMQ